MNTTTLPFGYLTEADEMVLNVMALDCKLSVDLGTCGGRSAAILSHHSERVITIDLFEKFEGIINEGSRDHYRKLYLDNPHSYARVRERLTSFTNVEVIQGMTHTAPEYLCIPDASVDLVFFDADHSYSGVKRDFEAWFLKVKQGGKFLFHDATNDNWDVKYFCNSLLGNNGCDPIVEEINVEVTGSVIRVFKKM